jgi:sarcosine oxidase subunit delta
MTFLITCPNCGPREALEFAYGGETTRRPGPEAVDEELAGYLFFRENAMGTQTEWWLHWNGCRKWFYAVRDTVTNEIERTYWPSDRPPDETPAGAGEAAPAGGAESA